MDSFSPQDYSLIQPLTPREQEILICIADGLTNRQIAERLTIAMSTVKWYVRQLYNKLNVDNRQAAIARAQRLGLVSVGEQEKRIKHNLQAAATSFVGREQELATLNKLIGDPQVRLITIVGPGGMGKTRLALEAARRQVDSQADFPDGVFFVELAPLETAVAIISTLAATINFQFQNTEDEEQQLLNYLRHKKMLLVMDNFEHILDGRMLLAEISKQAVGIKLLVTSRERLQLRGEQLFPLQGLAVGRSGDSEKEFVIDNTAVQLFLNISKQICPDFKLMPGDAEQLQRICRLVEGMPLGLELAASWVSVLPLAAIASEIEQSLQLLTTQHHDMPQRHRSMQASLDTSWQRLKPEQQLALQALTIFRGGFTRAAAYEVAGAMLSLLVMLVNKSWLMYDRQNDRYHIHELLRQYGAAKLKIDKSHEQAVRGKHGAYFCGYLNKREVDWFGPRQQETYAEVGVEIDNVLCAWRWAANKGDAILLAQGLNSLCRFYLWEGRINAGQYACRLAEDGLSKASLTQQSDYAHCLALLSQVLAWKCEFVREVAQKKELLAQSQQLLDRITHSGRDTRAEQAFIFLANAYAAEHTGIEKALRFGNLAHELFRELGDRVGEGEVLALMGFHYLILGSYQLANNLSQKSLKIRQQLGDKMGIAKTTLILGSVARFMGHFEEAESLQKQSLSLFQQLTNTRGERRNLGALSYTFNWAGNFAAAKKIAEQAIKIDQYLGQYPNPWRIIPLTQAIIHLGHFPEAHGAAAESLNLATQEGLLFEKGWALMLLGSIAFVEGNVADAKCYLLESVAILAELRHTYQAIPRAVLSYVARVQNDRELAHDYLARAIQSAIEYRSVSPLIYCLPAAALLTVDIGNTAHAIELYGVAQQFEHITNSRWFADIACRELDNVYASLPLEVAAAAVTRGRQMDVWATAESLLQELTNRESSQSSTPT